MTPRIHHINPDDPKWTAYVLGELDPAERAEIESLLETSEEARGLVEELTIATATMKEELTSLMPLMMSPEQRAAIRSAAEPAPRRWVELFPSNWGLGLAAAAMILLAIAMPLTWKISQETRQSADVPAPRSAETENPLLREVVIPIDETGVNVQEREEKQKTASAPPAGVVTAPVMMPAIVVDRFQDGAQEAAPAKATVFGSMGSLTGVVTDASRALIPGVSVTAANTSTGVVTTAITNESGAYNFPSLPAGTYQVFASLPGFRTQVARADIQNTASRLNYTLEVGAIDSKVEVTASAAQTLAQSARVGDVLTQERIQNLPLVGNNVLDLLNILPGTRLSASNTSAPNTVGGLGIDQVNVTRDGFSATDGRYVPGQLLSTTNINPDLVGEIRLQLSPVDAELGRGNSEARARAATPPPPPPAVAPPPPPPQAVTLGQQGQQGQGQQAVQGGARGGGGGGGRGGRGGGGPAAPVGGQLPQNEADLQAYLQELAKARGVGDANIRVDGFENANLPSRAQIAGVAAAPPPPPPAAFAKAADVIAPPVNTLNTEAYNLIVDNPFIRTTQENLATFSIDVDTASYANVRRFLNQNQLPPRDAVRIEELVNYFSYDYAQPTGNAPVAPNMEVAAAPWNPSNRLVRIGIKAREVNANRRPPSNLVFLIDVSGSMNSPERLPLVKASLHMLVERLGENDMVSMVVYAGNSGLVLPPTSGMRKETILQAINRLEAGGSTNGGAGIQLAYNQAIGSFLRNGVNRVILMTDGDFNVGITNQGDLTRLIEDRARSGVFLSVLGFGMGNIKDSTLERLADQGNGNYAYIDNIAEARKVLVEEMSGTLVTVAKDVKIQVDFNPGRVEAYRLIGYENRVLRTEDFNNDAKDAGDMGAGHTVTALFEVVPKGGQVPGPSVDPSKYTQPQAGAAALSRNAAGNSSNEMLTLRVRYKLPDSDTSSRMDVPLVDRNQSFNQASSDFRFAAAVAEFGMVLRNSPYRGTSRMDSVLDIAEGSRGADRNGYRAEFLSLVQKARNLVR
jgi:Ca-activated chloride channel family protein